MKALAWLVGLALSAPAIASAQNYRFPIELPSSGTQPYVTAYRDLDTGGGLLDWNCGSDTYNGHKGTDFGIGGFPVMDSGSRWIVAAAPGKVVFVNDGCADHCTTGDCGCGSGFGNYVKIEHADGKSTYYAHMMTGSIAVSLNEQVSCGQQLGKVGSSGNSTGPHLHFEPRYSNNVSDDPFSGSCGGPTSFWVNQGSYQGLPGDQCETPPVQDVDDAKLVSETVPDGTAMAPGQSFEKSWTLENTGNTTWSKAASYLFAHDSDETFSAPAQTELGDSESVAPGQTKTWTLTLTAPTTPGLHRGYFRMDRYGVARFGDQVHVEIMVESQPFEPDAGTSGSSGTGGGGWNTPDAQAGPDGSGGAKQKTTIAGEPDSGCACRSARGPGDGGSAALAGLALALAVFRRRRAR